jgi:hypothetical protein
MRDGEAMTDTEQWRPIQGFEGSYEVSDQGNVRSMQRMARCCGGALRTVDARVLKPGFNRHGYAQVGLCRGSEKTVYRRVQRLVLEAFVGPAPEGCEAAHRDGNKKNNKLLNLRWLTHQANMDEKRLHGTSGAGEKNAMAVLTVELVELIRGSPQSAASLARAIGVSKNTVWKAREGRTWANQLVSGMAQKPFLAL